MRKVISFLSSLYSCLSFWALSALFVVAWWKPYWLENGQWVKYGVGVMVLEFIVIHSSGFSQQLAFSNGKNDKERKKLILGLSLIYLIFGAGIAAGFKSWSLLIAFFMMVGPRYLFLWMGKEIKNKKKVQLEVAVSTLSYLILVAASVFIKLPRGGITYRLLEEVYPDRGNGSWERHPQQALGVGVVYFFILGAFELFYWYKNRLKKAQI